MLDPVETLQYRYEFMAAIGEVARLSNWKDEEIFGLQQQLWEELVKVDNDALFKLNDCEDEDEAYEVLEEGTQKIRYWLSLILGIKIKYF